MSTSPNPEYYVRQTNPNTYTVAKFEWDTQPATIYTLHTNPSPTTCSCPAWRRTQSCKHITLLTQWLSDGQPAICYNLTTAAPSTPADPTSLLH